MLQRKQTVFMLLSFLLTLACLCLPVGRFQAVEMGADLQMFNLWIIDNGHHNYCVAMLFLILLITVPLCLKAIGSYKNRMFQSKLCVMNIIALAIWYVAYGLSIKFLAPEGYSFKPAIAACFPLISIILLLMARKGIMDDEKLVRAADRIR